MTNIECKNNDLLPHNQFLNDVVSDNNLNSTTLLGESNNNNLNNDNNDNNNTYSNKSKNNEDKNKSLEYSNLQIKKFIDEFTEDQQIEIFKIIKYYDQFYSSNNNGVFINLDNVSIECKNDIIKFIKFSKHNDLCLDKMEHHLDKYKQLIDDSNSENN